MDDSLETKAVLSPIANTTLHRANEEKGDIATDGQGEIRFVELMLTVVATCRQQSRNVLGNLTTCSEADLSGQAITSLLPVRQADINVA